MKLNKKGKIEHGYFFLIMYAVNLDTEQSQVFVRRSSGKSYDNYFLTQLLQAKWPVDKDAW